jgi:DNA replication and repair protein RecF
VPVTRLSLTDFRNHASALIDPGSGFVLLSGDNGAGKTNVLEAVSLLTPGRGLRGAALSEMAREGGSGAFAIAVRLGEAELGTGTLPTAPERRLVRVNGMPAAVNSLSEWLSVLWLTPAMDRLFSGSAGERRRFLDRLVLALEPAHAHHSARYEAAMRARNKLLAESPWDEEWLAALEAQMGEHGAEVSAARLRTVADLADAIDAAPGADFPSAGIALDGWKEAHLPGILHANRSRDAAAGRATEGPHRQDLAVAFQAKAQPAARSSTGEQKALLLGIVLAHAGLVADRRGQPPLLLLDEVSAHLDPNRRAALYQRLEGRGQVWMTATESRLFEGIASASRFHVETGSISPA